MANIYGPVFHILARCRYDGNGCGAQEQGIKVPLENKFHDMVFGLVYDTFKRTKASKRQSISVNVIYASLPINYPEYIDRDCSSILTLDIFPTDDSVVGLLGAYDNLPRYHHNCVELGRLARLQVLPLRFNSLTGPIPTALSNCSNLQILQLSRNKLVGHIPWEFSKLSNLQNLYLWENRLNGEIPSSISNCTHLQIILDLDSNQFSGTVPLEFGKLLQLQKLVLWGNHLVSGSSSLPILEALTNCSSLEYIDLSLNNLTGIMPSTVGLLSTSLYYLGLALNELEGYLADEIGNLTKLAELQLRGNYFNRTIPSTLSILPNLERSYLNNNNLQGLIPRTLGQAKRLGLLALSDNMLSRQILDSLGDIPQLRVLLLHHNQL
ncbi:LRR receptor-like serine/threonine-protein kinase RGI5 [Cryptomeria japonica]|uniref:LRR receptor-like serine/threonine-protein kinase RGI5 n=1 Tax=Cryptomeria japonica TaxID=3369 RepID=UPI0027DA0C24|nr:LRR receptor-like serine/threonine-protein kinase RGI5 [Cryptomeria japonica]